MTLYGYYQYANLRCKGGTNMKDWERPMLVVLYKGRPEEGVLLACKTHTTPTGPSFNNNKCDNMKPNQTCGACQSQGGS